MDDRQPLITAKEMALLSPQQRADAVVAGTARSWDDVPEPFKSELLEAALVLGAKRRARA